MLSRLTLLATGVGFTCGLGTINSALAACGSTGCAINTNWETQGPHLGSGWRVDLRFEYIEQDSLRQGSDEVAHEAASGDADHHEAPDAHVEAAQAQRRPIRPQHEGEEHAEHDERSTLNRNARVRVDYSFDSNWGVSFDIPIVSRKHRHIELDGGATQQWDFTALGDVRILGRYAGGGDANMSWGAIFGAELPTGKYKEKNDAGATAERSLQPGSGTTDVVLGAFYQRGNASSPWSWFGQLAMQQALSSREDYKPGRQIGLDLGLGYRLGGAATAMLQLNLQHRARDRGANAEPHDSGSESAFLSPGIQVRIGANTQAYAFIQLPVYQHVNGTQLTADKALLLGLSHRF